MQLKNRLAPVPFTSNPRNRLGEKSKYWNKFSYFFAFPIKNFEEHPVDNSIIQYQKKSSPWISLRKLLGDKNTFDSCRQFSHEKILAFVAFVPLGHFREFNTIAASVFCYH